MLKTRTKNLFNKDNVNWIYDSTSASYSYINASTGAIVSNSRAAISETTRTFYIPCKASTTYSIVFNNTYTKRLGVCSTIPAIGVTASNVQSPTSTSTTITSNTDSNYLVVQLYIDDDYLASTNPARSADIIPSVMIVEGSTAPIEYIPYVGTIHELYKNNSGTAEYIGEMYKSDGNGGYEHIFSAGYDTTSAAAGSVATLTDARAKNISDYDISGNYARTITIDDVEYKVPNEYTLLEYAKATENISLSTNYTSSQVNTVEVKASLSNVTSNQYIVGCRNSAATAIGYSLCFSGHGGLTYYPTTWKPDTIATTIAENEIFVTKSKIGETETYLEVNGTRKATYTGTYPIAGTLALNLFSIHGNSGNEYYMRGSIYYCKMWQDDTLKAIYYPVKDEDGVVCYYDLLAQTAIYPTAGTLIAGPELESPSQLVETIGVGDKTINLFVDLPETTISGVTTTANPDGGIIINGTASQDRYIYTNASISAGTYTLCSIDGDISSSTEIRLRDSGTAIAQFVLNEQTKSVTFTVSEDIDELQYALRIDSGTVYNNFKVRPILVKGSSTATSYEPYNKYKFPLIQANNCGMVDLSTISFKYDSNLQLFYGKLPDAYYTASAKGSGCYCTKYADVFGGSWSGWANFPNKSISVGCNFSTSAGENICIKDLDYTTAADFNASTSGVHVYYRRTTDDTWTAPTITNIYDDSQLMKVDSYVDTIEGDGTRTNKIIKIDLGSLYWGTTPYGGYSTYTTPDALSPLMVSDSAGTGTSPMLCDCYKPGNWHDIRYYTADNYTIAIHPDGNGIWIRNEDYDDDTLYPTGQDKVNAFKAAMSGKYLYAALRTAATESITVPELSTAKGTNYIEIDTELEPSAASFTYRKKTK